MTKKISGKTKQQLFELKMGDAIISQVKQLLPYGSANQKESGIKWELRKTTLRTEFNYHFLFNPIVSNSIDAFNNPEKELDPNSLRCGNPLYAWLVTSITKAGNCDQFGALAYLRSLETFNKQYMAYWVHSSSYRHTFCIITENGGLDEEIFHLGTAIAIDPWPIKAQAVLFEDHFTFPSKPVLVWKKDHCGQKGLINAFKDESIEIKDIKSEYSKFKNTCKVITPTTLYYQCYSSKHEDVIEYSE